MRRKTSACCRRWRSERPPTWSGGPSRSRVNSPPVCRRRGRCSIPKSAPHMKGDPAAKSLDEIVFCYPGVAAVIRHRLARHSICWGSQMLARIIAEIAHSQTAIDIHPGAEIGESFFSITALGVVIGETAVIGRHVRLYRAVTLGARRFEVDERGLDQELCPTSHPRGRRGDLCGGDGPRQDHHRSRLAYRRQCLADAWSAAGKQHHLSESAHQILRRWRRHLKTNRNDCIFSGEAASNRPSSASVSEKTAARTWRRSRQTGGGPSARPTTSTIAIDGVALRARIPRGGVRGLIG